MNSLTLIEDIWKTMEGWMEPVKNFFFENHNNPFLWIVLFFIGILVFWLAYAALHRDR